MPAVKRLKIENDAYCESENAMETQNCSNNEDFMYTNTFCSFHLRPKKGLDRYSVLIY